MSKVSGKTGFLNKVIKNTKGAWSKVRDKKPEARGRLPKDISGGVAEVIGYEFKETTKKDPQLNIKVMIQEPEEYAGLKHTIVHIVADSEYSSAEEVLERISSDLQLMGAKTEGTSEEDIPDLVESITGNFFEFHTWETKKKKNVVMSIDRPLSNYVPSDTDEVLDTKSEEEEASVDDDIPFESLKDAGKAADNEDESSQNYLESLAGDNGLNPDDYETWSELATAIQEKDKEPKEEEWSEGEAVMVTNDPDGYGDWEGTIIEVSSKSCTVQDEEGNTYERGYKFLQKIDS